MALIHSGAKGQKWGVRNYRNYDGTLTDEGRERYDYYENKTDRVYQTARQKQLSGNKKYMKTGKWGTYREDLSGYSDDELKALTSRARIEADYRNFYSTERFSRGKRFINAVKTVGNEIGDFFGMGAKVLKNYNELNKQTDKLKKRKNGQAVDDDDDDDDKKNNK